ncbi:WD40 repeat-like protein [Wallemia mellicola]|nr:WD40 repeat-like protein [Wallemia mellicola]
MQSSVYATNSGVSAVCYDYYAENLATGSNDGEVSIHLRNSENNQWKEEESFKAHDSRVSSLSYSYPAFSKILATGSYDRTIKLWDFKQNNWNLIAKFTESKTPIMKLQFSSPSALQLVAISSDGILRVYQASVPSEPSSWSCLHTLHVTSSQPITKKLKDNAETYTISVCPDKETSGMLGVVAGNTNSVDIITYSTSQRTSIAYQLETNSNNSISSIAWSPGCQRGYWNFAAGSRDGFVRIFKLSYSAHPEDDGFKSELVAELEHGGVVASLSWNVFGNVLTSSGDNAKANVWKPSYTGVWTCHSTYTISE